MKDNPCLFRCLLVTVLLTTVGCATQSRPPAAPKIPETTPAQELNTERQARLADIDTWSFKGRAAVQRGDEGWSATLHWDQHGDAYKLRIIAPLGRGTYEVLKEDQEVSLIDPGNNVFKATSPEQLLTENIGWNLPISDIEYWVRGLIAPGSKPTQLNLDEGGLIKDIAVSGWRVSVLEYTWQDGLAMPRKLFMNYGDMKMRLVVGSWKLNSDAP
jgi:outer membrane lipoprotein LolB